MREYDVMKVPDGRVTERTEAANLFSEYKELVEANNRRLEKELDLLRETLFPILGPESSDCRDTSSLATPDASEFSLWLLEVSHTLMRHADYIQDIRQRVFN